jgi:hypothetical protein
VGPSASQRFSSAVNACTQPMSALDQTQREMSAAGQCATKNTSPTSRERSARSTAAGRRSMNHCRTKTRAGRPRRPVPRPSALLSPAAQPPPPPAAPPPPPRPFLRGPRSQRTRDGARRAQAAAGCAASSRGSARPRSPPSESRRSPMIVQRADISDDNQAGLISVMTDISDDSQAGRYQ